MWNLSHNISINNLLSNISIHKHQLYTNTISDREIHVSMEHKHKYKQFVIKYKHKQTSTIYKLYISKRVKYIHIYSYCFEPIISQIYEYCF